MILTPLQILPKNVGDLGKFIVAKCFEWLPKVQKIAQSGHTALDKQFVHCQLKATILTLFTPYSKWVQPFHNIRLSQWSICN